MASQTKQKPSVVIVYTGEGKGKTSAGLGLICRALGHGSRVAFIQFIKSWHVSEGRFLHAIEPAFRDKLKLRHHYDDGFIANEGIDY